MTGTAKTEELQSFILQTEARSVRDACMALERLYPKDSDIRWIHTINVSSLAATSTVGSEHEMRIHSFSLS